MYYRLDISTTTQGADLVSNALVESGADGTVIEDPGDFYKESNNKNNWDYMDKDIFDFDHEDVRVSAFFSEKTDMDILKKSLLNIFDRLKTASDIDFGNLDIRQTSTYEKDWQNEWKKYFHTAKVGEKIVISPSWEKYNCEKGEMLIKLDPGLAFGTGSHETTRMCIKALEKYIKKGCSLLDVGTGSGVLAVAGSLLGAGEVTAVDNDELAIAASKENIEKNALAGKINLICGNMADSVKQKQDIIVANIIAQAIINFAPEAYGLLRDKSVFISSGIIDEKADETAAAIEEAGFTIIERQRDGMWNMIAAKK